MIDGSGCIRNAISRLLPDGDTAAPLAIVDRFAEELARYAEVIVGPGGRPVGFMTRGEGPLFTDRVSAALASLDMPTEARAHQSALASWFEHKRGFFKVEWHERPLAAVYFRRRPPIAYVLGRLESWGVPAAARARALSVAATLQKNSVHFVSAAFRPGREIHHKLYFSQWVTASTRADVARRIGGVFELYGIGPEAREAWAANHERCLGEEDSTLFVSMSCSSRELPPSFKIDYPGLQPEIAADWLPHERRAAAIADGERARTLAGSQRLTFVGVRFSSDRLEPELKYYCDVPHR